MAYNCRKRRNIEENRRAEIRRPKCQFSSHKFKVLTSRVIQTEISNKRKKEKLLREVTVKIGLKQEDEEDGITVNELLDNRVTGLVMSSEFVRMHKFKKKLERPIEHIVEVNLLLFYKGHKEQTEIDIIKGQKWSMILGIPQLTCYNSETDWKTGEVKMTRYLNEC